MGVSHSGGKRSQIYVPQFTASQMLLCYPYIALEKMEITSEMFIQKIVHVQGLCCTSPQLWLEIPTWSTMPRNSQGLNSWGTLGMPHDFLVKKR